MRVLVCLSQTELLTLCFRSDPTTFRSDLFNIARTTLSSKVLSQDKDYFANLAVDAVLRLKVMISSAYRVAQQSELVHQGSTDLEHIQIIKKAGGKLTDSYLDEGTFTVTFTLVAAN